MDPVSPFPAIISLLLAMATAYFLLKQFGASPNQGRFTTIDGLRGYLAFFVFMHHSSIWYFYLRTGQWQLPPSNLYTHFGQSSVLLFFMITGFLFFSKLIDGKRKNIDWGKLFVSRFLRLVPLYLFAMSLLFIVVACVSIGILNEPIPVILTEVIQWLSFTVIGAPDLNGITPTFIIVAGVTWSLPYEWLFYFSLPLLALAVKVIPPLPYIALSIAGITGLVIWGSQNNLMVFIPFFSGIIAAILARYDLFRRFAAQRMSSLILICCMATAVALYPSVYGAVPLLLMTVVFTLIACGNNLFGLLVSPVSRTLGEMSYSIYLLHGITLFVTFNFVLDLDIGSASAPSAMTHWLWVAGITPVLICICFLTFRYIESPAMRSTATVTLWLRSHISLRPKKAVTSVIP